MPRSNPAGAERRLAIVAFVADYWRTTGYAPSLAEVGKAVGLRSKSSVSHQVGRLVEDGVLAMDWGVMRSLRVVAPTEVGAETARANGSGLSVGAVEMHSREPL